MTFLYDYMGRKVQKTVYTYMSGAWQLDKEISFVYDGWNLIKETTAQVGQEESDKYYIWGLDLSGSLQGAGGIGGLLLTIDNGRAYYYCYDANGNVGQLIDAADGSVAAYYQYYPFGELRQAEGVYWEENGFRFSTKYYDEGVNLYYYGYRYYSPQLSRWINRDRVESGGLNIYAFSYNNSIEYIDPEGLEPTKPIWSGSSQIDSVTYLRNLDQYNRIRAAKEREHIRRRIELEGPNYWINDLPDCPCEIPVDNCGCPMKGPSTKDSKWSPVSHANQNAHKGASWEIRWYQGFGKPGQQCTYDAKGRLITVGVAAGTPDRYGFDSSKWKVNPKNWGHGIYDLLPFLFDSLMQSRHYYWINRRPPNKGRNCYAYNAGTRYSPKMKPKCSSIGGR
jgi:RHS repeat-associated protein